jgi:hypothetical protein
MLKITLNICLQVFSLQKRFDSFLTKIIKDDGAINMKTCERELVCCHIHVIAWLLIEFLSLFELNCYPGIDKLCQREEWVSIHATKVVVSFFLNK